MLAMNRVQHGGPYRLSHVDCPSHGAIPDQILAHVTFTTAS